MTVNYNYSIAPGDAITVVFDGTTPDLECVYQRLADQGNTIIATVGANVQYIDDFQYFYKGVAAARISLIAAVDSFRVVFSTSPLRVLEGTLVAANRDLGWIEIQDSAGDNHICTNFLYATRI